MTGSFMRNSGLLRAASVSGMVLLLVFGGGLAVLYTVFGEIMSRVHVEVSFHRLLADYDFRYGQIRAAGQPATSYQLDSLSLDLDRLEARTEGVENWLSVLKRRRRLAADAAGLPGMGIRYARMFRESSLRALEAFPFSEPIAAVAAAAAVYGAAITGEMEAELRRILPRLTSPGFVPMRLNFHVLLGDFRNPETAAANLLEDDRFSLDFVISAMGRDAEPIVTSLAILRILEGEIQEAFSAVQSAMAMARDEASPEFTRFVAEFFYDFGDPVRAAELFHAIPGDDASSRHADALWLAGFADHARLIWEGLAAPAGETPPPVFSPGDTLKSRALYNLAVTAPAGPEAETLFERLVRHGRPGERYRELGLIHYSRLLDAPGAVAFLSAERGETVAGADSGGAFPIGVLIDLEILKRRAQMGEFARTTADAWILLNEHYRLEGLFQWAAWFFGLQRNLSAIERLLQTAERHNHSGDWKSLHEALRLIQEGRLQSAQDILGSLENADWAAEANLGRVLEARNAALRALDHYERALAMVMSGENTAEDRYEIASMLQFRIARCLRTLGRIEESRRALLWALELNPDNLNARLELGWM